MSNWSTPSRVIATIQAGDTIEWVRSANRKRILDAANCVPPLDKEQAKKMGLNVNVNWGELATLLTHAIAQMISAFMGNQYFFTVDIPDAPKEKQADWSAFVTNQINRILKKSIEYKLLQRAKWSSVAKHGVGPVTWRKADHWRPRFCALSDLRIATDTLLDFSNLNWYAQKVQYTVKDLMAEAINNNPNNHWKRELVADILKNYKEQNFTDATQNYDWDTDLEKFAGIVKQNGGFWGSNALPTIPLYHFYYEDVVGGVSKWFMLVVPDNNVTKGGSENDFLWKSDEPVGANWKELFHCQFGDLSFDDPPTFGGVRGLGFMLLDPTFYANLVRCRAVQHLFDQFNILLKITDPPDKARKQIQEFADKKVLGTGVSIVPAQERHQIKTELLEFVTAQMKQLQGEASSSYTQAADTGTQKEQTAFETRVKAEQVNALTTGIILIATWFEDGSNTEICRRFCLKEKDTTDPDIKKFRKKCVDYGIPEEWLDIERWVVNTVTPIGMGNPTIAQAANAQLQQLAPKLSPEAQREINHESVLTITKDPTRASRWAPIDAKQTQSDATREAIGLFATLLIAAPGSVPPPQNNYIDQIEVLLPLLAGKVMLYTKRNNMATAEEAMGLSNVLQYIQQAVQALGQDEAQKARVKQYTDALGKIGNEVKALAQRGAEAAKKQAQQQQDGEAARLHMEQVKAAHTMSLKDREAAATQRRKDAEFRAEQRRKDAESYTDIEREKFKALAGAHNARELAASKAANGGFEE